MPNHARRRRAANKRRAAAEQEKEAALLAGANNNGNKGVVTPTNSTVNSTATTTAPRPRAASYKFHKRPKSRFRFVILMGAIGYFVPKTFFPRPLPHPILHLDGNKPWHGTVDPTNDSLQFQHGKTHKVIQRFAEEDENAEDGMLQGPEKVLVGKDGRLFVLSTSSHLMELQDIQPINQTHWTVQAVSHTNLGDGVGRPMDGRFTADGKTLYIADAVLGLTRIRNVLDAHKHPKVELVANTVPAWMDNRRQRKTAAAAAANDDNDENDKIFVPASSLQYVNSLTIGPQTGNVYFTDATNTAPDLVVVNTKRGRRRRRNHHEHRRRRHWDVRYAAQRDLWMAKPAGRLCEYNPTTDQVRVLADNLFFASGIAVDPDETFLVIVETFRNRLLQFPLEQQQRDNKNNKQKADSKQQEPAPRQRPNNDLLRVLVEPQDVVGYMDHADCHHSKTTKTTKTLQCFIAVTGPISTLHKLWTSTHLLPNSLSIWLRAVLLQLPRRWLLLSSSSSSSVMLPAVSDYGGVLVVEITTSTTTTTTDSSSPSPQEVDVSYLQDPVGRDISHISSVTVAAAHDNNNNNNKKLYLGSSTNNYIGVYDLNK